MHFSRLGIYGDNHEVPSWSGARGPTCGTSTANVTSTAYGLFTTQIGHGRTELAEAASKQANELAYSPCGPTPTPAPSSWPSASPASRPVTSTACSSPRGGSEAVESAWKLARQYFRVTGQAQRTKVISRDISYHGTTMGALSITGIPVLKTPFEPSGPGDRQGAEHQLLPGTGARGRHGSLRPLGGGRDRAGDRARRARHGGRGLPRAGAELRWVLPAPAGLLRKGARHLRPLRRAPGVGRGDLRLRPPGRMVRGRSASTTSPTSSRWPRVSPVATLRSAR